MSQNTLQLLAPCRSIRISRLQSADHGAVVAMLERCSKVSLQRRFHATSDGLSYVSRLLADATGETGYAAWVAGNCVGLATLHVAPDGSADVGILVEDSWQRRGVGSALMTRLIAHARDCGLSSLVADVLADNYFIPAALARCGSTRTSISWGVATIRLSLERRSADVEGAP